jgi:hypothetical protein
MPEYTKQRGDRFGIALSPTPLKVPAEMRLSGRDLMLYGGTCKLLTNNASLELLERFTVMTSRRGSSQMQEQLTVKRRRVFYHRRIVSAIMLCFSHHTIEQLRGFLIPKLPCNGHWRVELSPENFRRYKYNTTAGP